MPGLMQIEQMPEIPDAIRFGSFSGYKSFLGGEGQGELTGLQLGQPHTNAPPSPAAGRAHLEELIKRRFPPEGKAQRVASALKALYVESGPKTGLLTLVGGWEGSQELADAVAEIERSEPRDLPDLD